MKLRRPALAFSIAMAALGSAAQAADIEVLTAWYGQSCGAAHGNVTSHVKWRCDGRLSCNYGVDANVIGDPAPNCQKNLVVLFACQGQSSVRLAQLPAEASGRQLTLSCAGPEPMMPFTR